MKRDLTELNVNNTHNCQFYFPYHNKYLKIYFMLLIFVLQYLPMSSKFFQGLHHLWLKCENFLYNVCLSLYYSRNFLVIDVIISANINAHIVLFIGNSPTHESDTPLRCLICMDKYSKPLVSVQCWHVHCEECWLRTLGAKKLCPQCNMITSPSDLRRIFL